MFYIFGVSIPTKVLRDVVTIITIHIGADIFGVSIPSQVL